MSKLRINLTEKCIVCGVKLTPTKWDNRNRLQYPLFCSSQCEWQEKREEYIANKSWLSRPKDLSWQVEKKCGICNKIYIPVRKQQRYCRVQCNKKAWKKRNWEYTLRKNREALKRLRERDPERERLKVRIWRKANPEWVRENSRENTRLRKSRIRAGGGKVSRKEWEAIKELQNQLCNWCHLPKTLTMDHIHPISKDGKHSKDNIQALCMECNRLKGNRVDFIPHTIQIN